MRSVCSAQTIRANIKAFFPSLRPRTSESLSAYLSEASRREAVLRSESSYYRILGSPVKSDDVISGAVILIFDETEKEHREQLRREFTANISHELKTPLTSISGFAELIESGMAQDKDAVHFAKKIRSEAGRLIDLVGDIIKLTQLDSGEIPYDSSTVELYEIICQTAERLRQLAASRGITITTDGTTVFTRGNRRILEEMIYNICDNAIKYNRNGGYVKLIARNDGETAHGYMRRYRNRDSQRTSKQSI